MQQLYLLKSKGRCVLAMHVSMTQTLPGQLQSDELYSYTERKPHMPGLHAIVTLSACFLLTQRARHSSNMPDLFARFAEVYDSEGLFAAAHLASQPCILCVANVVYSSSPTGHKVLTRSYKLGPDCSPNADCGHNKAQAEVKGFELACRYEVDKLTASQRLDLNLEKGRMRDELQALRDKANELEVKMDKETNSLKAGVEQTKNETIKYCLGMMLAFTTAGLGAARLVSR